MKPVLVRRGLLAAVASLLLPVTCGSQLFAQEGDCGKQFYAVYCAACHGVDGKGGGALAPHLIPKPTDLTQLAKAAGGKFPFLETVRSIDGRKEIGAHGTSLMPVWGEVFRNEPDADIEEQLRSKGKIMCIAEFLGAIQAK